MLSLILLLSLFFESFAGLLHQRLSDDTLLLSAGGIERVNRNAASSWTAGVNSAFVGKRFRDVKGWLGFHDGPAPSTTLQKLRKRASPVSLSDPPLPTSYDVYKEHPECYLPVVTQGQCGSDWAFSNVLAMSDRFCLATKGSFHELLSAQEAVSCDHSSYGCRGGYEYSVYQYMQSPGIVTDACFPYTSGTGEVPACPFTPSPDQKCPVSSVPYKKYYVQNDSVIHFSSAEPAMRDLYANGPITSYFTLYQDFFSYKSGVYYHQWGGIGGELLAKVQGWGVDKASGLKYWIVQLAWGKDWGMDGYFWMKRGVNECGFEEYLYSALPYLKED